MFLQEETHITRTVDPWGGSYYVEQLTHDIADKAWQLIQEIESYGGMTEAIEAGIPKMRIEEAAAKKQARIDSEQDIIVGVNKYKLDQEEELHYLEVDQVKVHKQQIDRLEKLKAERNNKKVEQALDDLTQAAGILNQDEELDYNLLELVVQAARVRATLGEISAALEKSFGRYQAKTQTFTGVYSKEIKADVDFEKGQKLTADFFELNGRRPRVMIAKMGQDGHDRGAKVIATSYADLGFDVDIGPLFQTPQEAAKQAVENDVHILGVSSLAAGHKTLVPLVLKELKRLGREDIRVIVGGVIPPQDHSFLKQLGVLGVYGPGTKISKTAIEILHFLMA